MSKKTWIVWAFVLLLPGAVGLGTFCAQKNARQDRIAQAAQADAQNPAAQEYLQMYQDWSNLPAQEKANYPWGYNQYGGMDIQERLKEGQPDRLRADLPELANGLMDFPDELAEALYGTGWQQEVENYKDALDTAEMILIGSTSMLAGGGLILAGGTVKLLILLLFRKRPGNDEESQPQVPVQEAVPADLPSPPVPSEESECPFLSSIETDETESTESTEKFETPYARKNRKRSSKNKNEGYFQTFRKQTSSDEYETSHDERTPVANPASPLPSLAQKPSLDKPSKDSYFGWAVEMDSASPLETLMTSEPLTRELSELTEEVSAIRQFAAQQQDQMRKLQDGYDWVIIRRFCLRVIRSIDNIEDRIAQMEAEQDNSAVYLRDIRDELVFTLESSGIEQFVPDLNVPYKGLEKYVEAVRERLLTEDETLSGCIGRVVRPGYQYLVNDDNVKIVRCAQVNLYEAKQNEQE